MAKQTKAADVRRLVHSPAEMATRLVHFAEAIYENPGIRFNIRSVDDQVLPLWPGRFVVFTARPGHCKTAMLAWLADNAARQIDTETECVIYVSWESAVEELAGLFLSTSGIVSFSDVLWRKADLKSVVHHANLQVNRPVWFIGHSSMRAERAVRMTPETIYQAIEIIADEYQKKPVLVCFDYIQIVPIQGYRDRVQQVYEVPYRIKEMAISMGFAAAAASQASREVDNMRGQKLPELRHNLWASSVEHAADVNFGLWKPWQTEEPGQTIEIADRHYPITQELIVMRLLKQRGDKGRWTWPLHFNMRYLNLSAYETDAEDLFGPQNQSVGIENKQIAF